MANAFTNVDNSELLAERTAVLEAFRQRLISYDADPAPRSPDLVEPVDTDVNDDGYTWNSVTGRWEGGSGGSGSGDMLSSNNLSDVSDFTEAAENIGIHAVGTLANPRVLAPVKWYWGTINGVIIGTENSGYDNGVYTAVDDDQGDPLPGAIPAPSSATFTDENVVPIGSTANVAIGVQVGDRVFFDERNNNGQQGVYVVTDLGNESDPWVLTRAADQPEAQILDAFIVQVEGTPIVIQTTALETDPEFIRPSIAFGSGSQATGRGAIAVGAGALAYGENARAWSQGSIAIGSNANVQEDTYGGIAIGHQVYNATAGTVEITDALVHNNVNQSISIVDGTVSLPECGWASMYVTADAEISGGPSQRGSSVTVCLIGTASPRNLTFLEYWTFMGEKPTTLAANKIGVLTLSNFNGDTTMITATWAVEQ